MEYPALTSSELELDRPVAVTVNRRDLMLVRTAKGLYALEDRCPHQSLPLADGLVTAGRVICRHHAVQVDLETGAVLVSRGLFGLPPVLVYKVEERDGTVYVKLPR